jgi:hypothetical protein
MGYGYPDNLLQRKSQVGSKILDIGECLDSPRKRWGFREQGEEGAGEEVNEKVSRKRGFGQDLGQIRIRYFRLLG